MSKLKEEPTSPPLNAHSSTAQPQSMMSVMMQQIQILADRVAKLSKSRNDPIEVDPISSQTARSMQRSNMPHKRKITMDYESERRATHFFESAQIQNLVETKHTKLTPTHPRF